MESPIVVATTWSATQADFLASYLRGQGIESFTKTNLDRAAYGGQIGGASVFVASDQRLEAELELALLEEMRPVEGASSDHGDEDDDARASVGVRSWVRVASYITLAAMVLGTAVPVMVIVWSRTFG